MPHIMAVNRGALSRGSREYKSVKYVPRTELQDLHGTFYICLIEQLQPLPYVFPMNAALTVFRKQNWTITWNISWPIPLLCGVSASLVLWNNG